MSNNLSDFRNFLWLVWTAGLTLPEPEPVQYNIAWELQYGFERSEDNILRCQIQAFRGVGKSYILCAYIVWRLLQNPDLKILLISMNTNRAKEAVRLCRQIIDTLPCCAHLIPTEEQRDGADRFDVGAITRPGKDPSVAAYGITSAVAGTHPDIIIADDTETKENALTALKRERLLNAYWEFEHMIKPGGTIVHMGTPQSGDSVYLALRDKYHLKRWPCRFPDPTDKKACKYIAPWCLEQVLEGEAKAHTPTCPARFSEAALAEKLAIMGPYVFALQMMLDTNLADEDRYPLKQRNLVVMDLHPDVASERIVWGTTEPVNTIRSEGFGDDRFYGPVHVEDKFAPYQTGLMFVDPSGGGDAVGYAVLKGLNGMVFLMEAGGLPGGHSRATLVKLSKVAQFWGIKRVVVESNFGAGAQNEPSLYEKALGPVMAEFNGPVQIEGKRVRAQKEMRICDTLQPITNMHRLIVNTGVAKNSDAMYQYTHVTRDRGCLASDDIIDAIAGGVEFFSDFLGLDPEVQVVRHREDERRRLAEEFASSFRNGLGSMGFSGEQPDMSDAPMRPPARKAQWARRGGRWTNV